MIIQARDRQILRQLARFQQLTLKQVDDLMFTSTSLTPAKRAMKRLMDMGLVLRLNYRVIGEHGGSSAYVYALTTQGMRITGLQGKSRRRTVDFHALAVADLYVELLEAARLKRFSLDLLSVEVEAWQVVGGVDLRPDLRIDATRPSGRLSAWIEADLGTEGRKQLRGKLESYVAAFNAVSADEMPVFPLVLWIAVDQERAKELEYLVKQVAEPSLFRVGTNVAEIVDNC